ncbi:MAG: ribonuclease P protein component, partial [Bacilli bacterium]|nr:ribonuclease P protein component [Bacilli bacterium]
IHVLANELKKTRIGISVSSRLGSAIKRNKIKRQVRAMCDALIDYNFLSVDIVIVVKQQFMLNDFWQNKELLQFLLTLKRGT